VLVGHELVADAPSWRILVEDLTAVYLRGPGGLRPKTMSFERWASRLAEEVEPAAAQGQAAAWRDGPWAQVARLPLELAEGPPAPLRTCVISLAPDEVRVLTERLVDVHRADPVEALIAVLSRSLAAWTGGGAVCIDVIDDGRRALDGLDLARTVGCFATTYPLLLEVRDRDTLGEILRAVKQKRQSLPQRGLGFGLLRWGHTVEADELARLPAADIALCHLGAVDDPASPPAWPSRRPMGERRSLAGRALVMESVIADGGLVIHLHHDPRRLPSATADRLAADLLANLRALAAEERRETEAFTPADFPLADLDASQLSALAALVDEADQGAS
jgi:phthiocerol/phenolphthiocerol synthesis type-I polyketide synthase E